MAKRSAVEEILKFNAGRDPERLARKYAAMRDNAFAFLRGTCHLFHRQLPSASVLSRAPAAWSCCDLHLQNFGSFKGGNRLVYFDISDFDEALLAPCTWDLLRLSTSIVIAADALTVKPSQAKTLCRRCVGAYAWALCQGRARWIERDTAQGMVGDLLDELRARSRKDFLDARTVTTRRRRTLDVDGKRALPIDGDTRGQLASFMKAFARTQPNPKFFTLLDAARRIAGTGSLGVERFVLLVEGKGSPDGNYLLDFKQALPASARVYVRCRQPRWKSEAERIVQLQSRMQAIPPAFLNAVEFAGKPYVLKELQPTQDRVALEAWNGKLQRLEGVVTEMGRLLAWAQLRSSGRQRSAIADELIAFAAKKKWQGKLLDLVRECGDQVERDWREYCQAYDDGAFTVRV